MIAVFVDDGLIIGKNKSEVEEVLSRLARKLEITSECPKQGKLYYLGMEINFMKNGIFLKLYKKDSEIVQFC